MRQSSSALAATLLALLAACTAPSERGSSSSGNTIPETVSPTCTTPDAGSEDGGTTDGGKVCTCRKGYELDGDICRFIDLCKEQNGGCSAHATCTPKLGDRLCKCTSGYTGDGVTCTPTGGGCSTCDPNASCRQVGTSDTCVCNEGYTGDGYTCTANANPCDTANGGCNANADCTVGSGNQVQCTCKAGFTGDGYTCVDVGGPCAANNGGCSPNAICTVGSGNQVQCTCKQGYTGNGYTCTPVSDPCAANNGGCSPNAICTVGSGNQVQCTCKQGYTGNGYTCTPVSTNPCLTNNGGCDPNASCFPTGNGSVECTCNSGYTGNGYTCTAVANTTPVGATCADSSAEAQSTCQSGYNCYAVTDDNYCSKTCSTNADCGSNGVYANTCADAGISICLRGCSLFNGSTCGRSDLGCYELNGGGSAGVCWKACTSDDDCAYGSRCDASARGCKRIACNSNGTCANANDVCYTRTEGATTVKSCVPKCTLTGCPSGRQCNTTSKVCEGTRATYETCGQNVGDCKPGNECVEYGDPGSLCMKQCTSNANCPSGSTCSLTLGDGSKVCAITCGTEASPNTAACPSGTVCNWYLDSTKTTLLCGP
jgi:hypothetical protein